jgi:hypothetical protein
MLITVNHTDPGETALLSAHKPGSVDLELSAQDVGDVQPWREDAPGRAQDEAAALL